ncbi:MAG: hypothetical protein AAF433_14690 [Bacteroidota bacterium]
MTLHPLQNCPSEQQLLDYHHGRQVEEERFRLEDHLLDCPLCAAAVRTLDKYGAPPVGLLTSIGQTPQRKVELTAATTQGQRELPIPSTERQQKTTSTHLRSWRSYWPAAAIILLLVIAYGFYRSQQISQQLFSQYFDPQPTYGYVALRSLEGPPYPQQLQAALQAHQAEDFALSISSWTTYANDEIDNLDYRPHLYLATARMALGQLEEADYELRQLPAQGEQPMIIEANWYRALLDLRKSKPKAATDRLRQIRSLENTIYAPLADELLQELE